MLNNRKLFIALFLAFIAATVIGTVSHECGHYLVARMLGYHAHISYKYTWIVLAKGDEPMSKQGWFLFILGGPLETMLTGTIGVILLFIYRRRFYQVSSLSAGQWLIVFISLFWLRPVANFVTWMGGYTCNGSFSGRGDEVKIARYLHWTAWSVPGVTAIIGLVVSTIVCFKFIPASQRLTFILAGFLGAITGYLFWLVFFGKYLLP